MRRTAAAAVLLLMTAACSDKPSAQDQEDRISDLQSQNSSLQQQLDEAHSQPASPAAAADLTAGSAAQAREPEDQRDNHADEDAAYGNDDAGHAANQAVDAANEAAAAASGE